jgi:nucleotide-binding universal stress UspA family protein
MAKRAAPAGFFPTERGFAMEGLMRGAPFVESILHPTDLSDGSQRAFSHALALALRNKAKLTILHVGKVGSEHRWIEFPSVRKTLAKWGLLEEGSSRSEVFRNLDVRVKKVNLASRRPLSALINYLQGHDADLVVLATEGRGGFPRLIRPSTAEAIARSAKTKVLFVPRSARGFVSPEDGSLAIRRILVPVDRRPDPAAAIFNTAKLSALSATKPVEAVALHVGSAGSSPEVDFPGSDSCAWLQISGSGDVVRVIVREAGDRSADLIVMATEGHAGVLGALRGSVTEQVLRAAPCPVLAVPAGPDRA